MSEPPGIIDRVNYVAKSWNNPCNAPWAVYVESVLPAALEVAVALVCFDIFDVARFIFRPANLRSGRHGSRRRKGRHGRKPKGIRALLARKLPPFQRLQQRKITQGVKTLWVIDGIGQRALWWWLVIDVASGFLYNWTSMVRKSEACQQADSPGMGLRRGNSATYLAIQVWPDVSFATLDYAERAVTLQSFSWGVGLGEFDIVASLQLRNSVLFTGDAELRIRVNYPGNTTFFNGGPTNFGPGAEGGLVATANVQGPVTGWVEVQIENGRMFGTDSMIYIQGRAPVAKPPVEHNCPIPFFND